MTRLWILATLAPLTLSGCHLWFNDDCATYGAPEIDAVGLFNPYTAQCEWQGGGGGDICGDYGGGGDVAIPAEPLDWAQCYGACGDLAEEACLDAPGCRAGYAGDCPEGFDCGDTTYAFAGCWDVAPSGPVQGADCTGLDAYQCSLRDDCSPYHYPYDPCQDTPAGADCAPGMIEPGRAGNFDYCAAEPGANVTCADALSESACVSQAACAPIYVGVGCACDEQTGECTCQDWLFEQCSDA